MKRIKKQFWLSEKENADFMKKVELSGLSQSAVLRITEMLWQENELANEVKTWNDKLVQMAELFLPYIILTFINILQILLISIYKYVTMLFIKQNINQI